MVAYLFSLAFPPLLPLTIPFGVLVGILIGLGRMSSDGEITAMRAAGIPSQKVILPVMTFALMAATALVNLAPANPYMTASFALWQQGHFLNFNGATRVVSAVWPFAAMVYLVLLAADRGQVKE